MTNNKLTHPPLTPFQAMEALRGLNVYVQDYFKYYMDGPMMSPSEMWAPVAINLVTDETFCTSGEPGDAITETFTWHGEPQ